MITDDPQSSSPPDAASFPTELSTCHAMIQQLIDAQQQQARMIDGLQSQLKQLLRRMYGKSSEKIDPNQLALFAEMLKQLKPDEPLAPMPNATSPEPAPATASNRSNRHKHGRRQIPDDLPRVRTEIDLPEAEKPCPCCGKSRCKIGEEISEKLDYVPAKIQVIQTARFKYACKQCDAAGQSPQIVLPELPASPIEKGLAAPGLLSYVIVSKYSDHLPLHRLEKILDRHQIDISRSTMCDWMAQSAEALWPLYDLMKREILQSKVIHTDDTPVDVLDKGRTNTRTGRFWVYLGDTAHPYTIFDYTPSRSRDGPVTFLVNWGKDRRGDRVYLQADAFGGYDVLYQSGDNTNAHKDSARSDGARSDDTRSDDDARIIEVACWAHARRKFFEARDSNVAVGTAALAHIKLLYDIEHQASQMSPTDRAKLRQQQSLPRLEAFKTWLQSQQATRGGPVLPKSPMGQAIQYALNQWDALCVYSTDGDLNIDNNASENALRRIAVGRNNWLFCGSDQGGRTASILFTMIASCERHHVNPFDYLKDVLTRIADIPVSQLADLLPGKWKPVGS